MSDLPCIAFAANDGSITVCRVPFIKDPEALIVAFRGAAAESRAREYAEWMNSKATDP